MKTLSEALERYAPDSASSLMLHLSNAGIYDWTDCSILNLNEMKSLMNDAGLAPNTIKTYLARLKGVFNKFKGEQVIPCDFEEVLKTRGEKAVKTYLTPSELERLERVECLNDKETFVLNEFIVGAKTGARISDIRTLTADNISEGHLTYTSQKTNVKATVPCSDRTTERISYLQSCKTSVSLVSYNDIIRRLCRRAGIDAPVYVHRGGTDKKGEKWQFVSSHTARISFCTNLYDAGVALLDIAKLAGHTNQATTMNYIARQEVRLNENAMKLFA